MRRVRPRSVASKPGSVSTMTSASDILCRFARVTRWLCLQREAQTLTCARVAGHQLETWESLESGKQSAAHTDCDRRQSFCVSRREVCLPAALGATQPLMPAGYKPIKHVTYQIDRALHSRPPDLQGTGALQLLSPLKTLLIWRVLSALMPLLC